MQKNFMTAFVETHSPSLINPRYQTLVSTAAAATGIAALSVFVPIEAIRIIGMTVLAGVGYGVANDSIACRDCIEYFTVGHFYDGRDLEHRPLLTLDPNLNALAWGAIATWHVCAIAGTFFALLATLPFPGLVTIVSAVQLAPFLAIGAAVTLLISHVKSRIAQKEMAENPYYKYFVPLDMQAGWEACNVRNSAGYLSLGLGGIVLSAIIVAARVGLIGF